MAKTVLITGTSSGFGEEASRYFAAQGWNVVATMRAPKAGNLPQAHNVLVTRLDVQDRASIESAIEAGIARFGRIDVVVNNAGYGQFGIFEGVSSEKIREQFDVNVFGVMDVMRAMLPHFRAQRSGTFINISSGAGAIGFPMASLYCASKFALEGFSEAVRWELASLGIKVKIVEPGGATKTGFQSRMGAAGAGLQHIPDYLPFLDQIGTVYAGMGEAADHDAIEKVVAAIFTAATDGSDQLRYTPTSDIAPILKARRSSSESEYQAFTTQIFGPAKN